MSYSKKQRLFVGKQRLRENLNLLRYTLFSVELFIDRKKWVAETQTDLDMQMKVVNKEADNLLGLLVDCDDVKGDQK